MNPGTIQLTVINIEEVIPGFRLFSLISDRPIFYKAGQYLTFLLDHHKEEIRRSYSLTSAPSLNEPLTIGVRRTENGIFSRYLFDKIKQGGYLITIGAGGLFTIPADIDQYQTLMFFAAGSGITPVYSLIRELLATRPAVQLVLIYSSTAPERTIFLEELKSMQSQPGGRLIIHFLFGNSSDLYHARLHRDLFLELLHQYIPTHSSAALFYICGPEAYMRFCTYTLQEQGFSRNQIKKENFIIPRIHTIPSAIPDKETHVVQVNYGGDRFNFEVSYPDSILKAARKKGISLPYSCESGQCGNCVARCLSGKVWHAVNDVLTDKELKEGLVLTCVGHPVGGPVVISIE